MLIQDFRYALRILRKSPAFTLVAVLTLALGVGATTAMFSVLNQGLLHPLPYSHPEQLVKLNWTSPGNNVYDDLNAMQGQFFTEHSRALRSAGVLFTSPGCNLAGAGRPEYVQQAAVSTGFFKTLDVTPVAGRNFLPEDVGSPGHPHVAIISHELWKSHFNADENIVGQAIQCNGLSYTVIGLLPQGFTYVEDHADVWVPDSLANHIRDNGANYYVFARLNDGVSIEQAQQEMNALSAQFRRDFHAYVYSPRDEYLSLDSYGGYRASEYRTSMLFLFGAVGLLLLIACANVAGLILARANGRTQEIAVRLAIGASRGRIMRQLLTESLLLNVCGCVAGLLLVLWAMAPLSAIVVQKFPAVTHLQLDVPVLIFAIAASLVATLISGLTPAIKASRPNVNLALKQQVNSTDAAGQQRTRKLLVITEVAVAVVLLLGSTLLLRSFLLLKSVSPGLNPDNLQVAQFYLSSERYQATSQVDNFLRELQARAQRLPGVTSAGVISGVPTRRGLYLQLAGGSCKVSSQMPSVQYRPISASYLATVGIPLRSGRSFQDKEPAPVALINETLARQCWKGANPLNDQAFVNPRATAMRDVPRQIVGIVGDTRDFGLSTRPRPTIYVPVEQTSDPINKYQNGIFRWSLVVHTSEHQDLSHAIPEALAGVDPLQPVASINSVSDLLQNWLAPSRLMVQITGFFGSVALLLTAIGLYGLLSYSILQRTREIGIRMALGARQVDVLQMVVREGLVLVAIGAVVGVIAALAGNKLISSLLYQIKPVDPLSFAAAIVVLLAVAFLASYLPARRATRIDPMVALRCE